MAAKRRRSSTSSNKIYSREDMEIFDLLEYPVWVYDMEEKVMFWANESALELWNADSLDTLLSRCYSSCNDNDNMSYLTQRKLNECMAKFQRGETVREQRTFFDPQEGTVTPIHLIMSGIQVNTRSGPRMLMLVEANRGDVTSTSSSSSTEYTIGAEEEEEETKKKEAELTAAALARHELRTPLHQVIGFIELLSQTDMTDQQMEYVSPMQSASRSLMNVLEESCDNLGGGGTGTSTVTTTSTHSSSSLDTMPPPPEEAAAAASAPEEEPIADTKPVLPKEVQEESSTHHEGLEVLVAEDSKLNQKLVKAMLQRMGHKVTLADDGALAVEQIETNKPNRFDVILMDKDMPVMGGIEATKLLRSKGYSIPIVGFTATYHPSEKDFYEESGMNDCIAKPARPNTLQQVLNEVVRKQEKLFDSKIAPRVSQGTAKPKKKKNNNTLFKSVSLCAFGDKKHIGYHQKSFASAESSPSSPSWERKGVCLGRSSSWASIPAEMTSRTARTLSPPRLQFARLA